MASTQEFEFPRFDTVGEGRSEGVFEGGPAARPSSASLITLTIPEDGPLEVPAPMDVEGAGGMSRREGRVPTISGNRETVHRVGQVLCISLFKNREP